MLILVSYSLPHVEAMPPLCSQARYTYNLCQIMKIHFADSSYQVADGFKRRYVAEVRRAYRDVSKLLPFGSRHINFFSSRASMTRFLVCRIMLGRTIANL